MNESVKKKDNQKEGSHLESIKEEENRNKSAKKGTKSKATVEINLSRIDIIDEKKSLKTLNK